MKLNLQGRCEDGIKSLSHMLSGFKPQGLATLGLD